jgi:ubiquinone/menaquinone biosynthesis C-methylase UbiE
MEATTSQEQFDRQAAMYAASAVHRFGASLPVLVEFAAVQDGEQALDVATGTGNTAIAIAKAGANVTGLDVSAGMLAQAKARTEEEGVEVRFIEGSAESMPFEEGSFDLVTARHAPHHFRNVRAFLTEVRRVLRPGGRFVMADGVSPSAESKPWFDRWQLLRDPSHFSNRTVEEWRGLAADAGFDWKRDALVPYRLEFTWWTQQAGCSPEALEALRAHVREASPSVRQAVELEMSATEEPIAYSEPMLVVRLETPY